MIVLMIQIFWDTYDGAEANIYKEYRMSKATFNQIVQDCLPVLYDRELPAGADQRNKFRRARGKVTMATLIRFLATQSDQHAIGKRVWSDTIVCQQTNQTGLYCITHNLLLGGQEYL